MIKAIYRGNEFFESASGDSEVGIIIESTSFYAEQGGQVKFCQSYSAIYDLKLVNLIDIKVVLA